MSMEFVKYFFSSGVAFLVDYITLYLSVQFLGLNYLVGAIFGFSLGLLCVYFLSTCWIFDVRRCQDRYREFVIFVVIGLLGLLINVLVLFVCTDLLGTYYLWSKLWSVAVVFSFNFGMRKYFLFRE